MTDRGVGMMSIITLYAKAGFRAAREKSIKRYISGGKTFQTQIVVDLKYKEKKKNCLELVAFFS